MQKQPTISDISTHSQHLVIQADLPGLDPPSCFECFTRPDLLIRWWPQQAKTRPELAGDYVLSWPQMGWHLRGTYSAFIPGKRLAFSWHWDHEPEAPVRQVDIHFESLGFGTRLQLSHGPYDDTETEQAERQGHRDGWNHFLPRLGEIEFG